MTSPASSRTKTVLLNRGQPLLPVQDAMMRSPAIYIAVFGGWRSGKTLGCALKFFANCVANPWTPDYGDDRPFSIVIGLTHKVMADSAYRELRRIIPKEAVLYEKKGEDWHLQLTNGHVIKFRTAKGMIEGASACGVWLDEAHLLPNESAYLNYQMRASDALSRRDLVLVSGLPESGWLQDTFDRPEHAHDPSRLTLFARTMDNRYLKQHVISGFRQSVSKKSSIKYLEGRWMPREGAIYHEWNPTLHLVRDPGSKTQPVHLGIDIGNKGVVLFLQERMRPVKNEHGAPVRRHDGSPVMRLGLHVVDEYLMPMQTTEASLRDARARGWPIVVGRSKLFIDPTTRPDEIQAIRTVFGDIEIVKQKLGSNESLVDYGIDCVNAALLDMDDNVMLTFSDQLPREPRSLLTAIPRYHRKNGHPVKDDTTDHALDALRYPVAGLLPLRRYVSPE